MSTNIDSAWKIPDQLSIRSLVELAHDIKERQEASFNKEVAESVFRILKEYCNCFYSHFNSDENRNKASIVIAAAVQPIIHRYWDSPIFVFPQSEYSTLRSALRRHSETCGLDLTEELFDDITMVSVTLYEQYSKSHPTLVFLSDSWSCIYLKGFGLTNVVEAYLSEKFPSYNYTDATDMPLGCFPGGDTLAKVTKTEEERDEMASLLQQERGRIWDDILNGHTNFKDAGLSFVLGGSDALTTRANLRKVVLEFFALEGTKE